MSRALADLAEATEGAYQLYVDQAIFIIERHDEDIEAAAADLTVLYEDALSAFQLENKAKMSCAGDIDVSPLSITTHPDSLESNEKRTCSIEQGHNGFPDNAYGVELALEKEPCGGRSDKQRRNPQAGRGVEARKLETNLDGVSIGLIQSACTQVQTDTDIAFGNWSELCSAADQLRILIGLSHAGYQDAVERQGKYLAAACLVVVAEKALRDPEQITSPGGYFRAMIDRAGEGKLHLHKSLHGLAAK